MAAAGRRRDDRQGRWTGTRDRRQFYEPRKWAGDDWRAMRTTTEVQKHETAEEREAQTEPQPGLKVTVADRSSMGLEPSAPARYERAARPPVDAGHRDPRSALDADRAATRPLGCSIKTFALHIICQLRSAEGNRGGLGARAETSPTRGAEIRGPADMSSIRAGVAHFLILARGETRLALAGAPNIAWRALGIFGWGLLAVLMGSIVGFAAATLPPMALLGILMVFALVLLWVLPDGPTPPDSIVRLLLFLVVMVDFTIPTYYTVQFVGLPWISARRICTFALILLFAVAYSTSKESRQRIGTCCQI